MNDRRLLGQCLLILLVSIFVTRGFYHDDGVVGHNWDWVFSPYDQSQFFYDEALFVWHKFNFGFFSSIGMSSLPSNIPLYVLTAYFSTALVSKLAVTGAIFLSGVSFSLFLNEFNYYINIMFKSILN